MSVLDLVNAIQAGDSQNIEKHFEYEMTDRIAERLDSKREEVARNMFKENLDESKISPLAAKEILHRHDAHDKDFFSLSHSQVSDLHDTAKKMKYRAHKNAPGSTARMFHQHLSRLAKKVNEEFDDITPEDIEEFMQTEEFEQLDEISKDTLRSYMDKSIQSYSDTGTKLRAKLQKGEEDPEMRKKIKQRLQGQMKAYDKLKK